MIALMSLHSRLISLLIGFLIMFIIFYFVRRKYLDQIYALIWLLIGVFFIGLSIFPKILDFISILLGIDYLPFGILVVAILGLGAIVLHMSTIITLHNKKIREFEKKISFIIQDKDNK